MSKKKQKREAEANRSKLGEDVNSALKEIKVILERYNLIFDSQMQYTDRKIFPTIVLVRRDASAQLAQREQIPTRLNV